MRSRRSYLSLLGTAGIGTITGCAQQRDSHTNTIFVATNGHDTASGTKNKPLRSIQSALDRASPGDTIHVRPGVYREYLETTSGGSPDRPVTLTGPANAVVKPPKSVDRGRPLLAVRHSHFYVTGLTLNGQANAQAPDSLDSFSGGIDLKADPERHEYMVDLKLMPHAMGNFKGAMISTERIRNAEIGEFRVIGPAGLQYILSEETGGYAEIVYLGTWVGGIDDYEWDTLDETRNIRVHHIDNSAGYPHAELVDAKPGTHDITIEYCTDAGGAGRFKQSPAIGVKGRNIVVRWNELRNGGGSGIEVGSSHVVRPDESPADVPESALDEGRANSIYGNRIHSFERFAIDFHMTEGDDGPTYIEGYGPAAQTVVCGNEYSGDTRGNPDNQCPDSVPTGAGIGHTGGDSPW